MGTDLFKGVRLIDFEERVADYIDTLDVGFDLVYDTNLEKESVSLARLPGGQVVRQYYDGIQDKQLNYELTIKAKKENRPKAISALSKITDKLSQLGELKSDNGSYDFQKIDISNEMYFNEATTDGFIYFRAHFQPYLTIY